MDEFDPDTLLRELSDSIGDSDKFIQYVKERTSVLIERFLEYLPKMSIPIERRELEGGWVLTCRGKRGGDLCLSDISMDRENVLCYVLGGDENVLQPLANTLPRATLDTSFDTANTDVSVDGSILDEVRELIVSAQQYNNWVVGVNGIKHVSICLRLCNSALVKSSLTNDFAINLAALTVSWDSEAPGRSSHVRYAKGRNRLVAIISDI